jgi:hypothetical protein
MAPIVVAGDFHNARHANRRSLFMAVRKSKRRTGVFRPVFRRAVMNPSCDAIEVSACERWRLAAANLFAAPAVKGYIQFSYI